MSIDRRLRNCATFFRSNDAGHVRFVKSLGTVTDAIGEWHDWEELIAISTKLPSHGPSCRLLHEFRVISSRRYESALSITNKMRKDYLKSANLNARGSGGDKDKAGQPVIKAVSTTAA